LKWLPNLKVSTDFYKVEEGLWHCSHFSENCTTWHPLHESCCVSRWPDNKVQINTEAVADVGEKIPMYECVNISTLK